MTTKQDDYEKDRDEQKRPIETRWGTSDADTETGEPMSGRSGPEDQEEASDFIEELGGLMEGKEPDELHEPSMEEEDE